MARLVSFDQFDIYGINLNWYDQYAVENDLIKNYNFTFNGVLYPDAYYVAADDGYDFLELDFFGSNLTADAFGNITGGTVNMVAEVDIEADAALWYAEGLSVSAVSIYNAALTPSNTDEIALFQTAFSGDDTIILSPYSDRMTGFAGNDTITGGGGRDMLSGGAGNDLFLDTAAGLNGDTITDFSVGDRIIVSDANISTFTYSVSGSTLQFGGASLTLLAPFGGQLVVQAAAGGGVQLAIATDKPSNDFNGDGRSDILWRNSSGALTDWLGQANGSFVGNANASTSVATSWQVGGTGDFNGDGRADILWRNDSGAVTNWLGQSNGGFTGNDANAFNQVDISWQVRGTGDFNGDGRDDILWVNSTGRVAEWLGQANGGFTNNGAASAQVDPSWNVAGTGDFNGDGRDDVLWRNENGALTNWLGQASGALAGNANAFYQVDLSWHVVGTGDFNGDGRSDVLWRNESGALTDWLGRADGSFESNSANAFNMVATSWHVDGTGDYNGDGRDDILWRNDNGALTNWLGQGNGGFVGNGSASLTVTTDWQVQPDLSGWH